MVCNAIRTGEGFLQSSLAHLDCQAQVIGSFGFMALGGSGSVISQGLTAILAIFIAIFGLRLLFGYETGARDVVSASLKIGIVLTLATSWPAYRTVVYDTILHGPAEMANAIGGASGLPGSEGNFDGRLQTIDNGILALTALGSGREAPGSETQNGETIIEAFRPIAVSDNLAFGSARVVWLACTLGSIALVRIAAGLLLALAPIFACFLLFQATRSLFFGWLRGLGLTALGALAVTIILSVEAAVLEPWLQDALNLRIADLATPSAPTELLVIVIAFGIALFGIVAVVARIIFSASRAVISEQVSRWRTGEKSAASPSQILRDSGQGAAGAYRRQMNANRIETVLERQSGQLAGASIRHIPASTQSSARPTGNMGSPVQPLGSSYRRTSRRMSPTSKKRDDAI